MFMELNINGRKATTLLRTNVISSGDPFVAYADSEYGKRKRAEHQRVLDEIIRRNEYDYGV